MRKYLLTLAAFILLLSAILPFFGCNGSENRTSYEIDCEYDNAAVTGTEKVSFYNSSDNSFKELKGYWLNEVKSLNAIIAVAANKCDDLDEKRVKDEEGKEFADSIGAIFAPISAKDNFGIKELFQKVGEAIKIRNNNEKMNN